MHPGLIEALGVAVYTTDIEGRLTAYNEAAVELWGWRPPLRTARWCGSWRLFHSDGRPMRHEDCPMAVALRESRPVRGAEGIAERPDGVRVPFIPYPTPLRDAAGTLVGAVNVLVDISARKAAESALAGSEARLRAVFEATPECIKVVAPDGTLLQMNAAGLRIVDAAAPAEIEDRSVFDVIAPEHRAAWRVNHERVCRGEAVNWAFDVIGLRGIRRSVETRAVPLSLPDGRLAHLAVTRDVTARNQAAKRQALLVHEVDHRARNALAVALSLVRLTRAEDPHRFAEAVQGHIAALAHAHTLLAEVGWTGAELRAVAETELAPYLPNGHVHLRGPSVILAPAAVQPLAMILHELATNAAKYGALSVPTGHVEVAWGWAEATSRQPARALELRWTETGGPPVPAPPRQRGFGSRLIAGTSRDQLGGSVLQRWESGGLCCVITVGADRLQRGGAGTVPEPAAASVAAPQPAPALAGCRVLLAEDELLVAMDLAETLRDLGCEVLGPAATVEEALRLASAEGGRIDAAVLDVNLAGRPSFPVADLLAAQAVPVVFATGYGDLPDGRTGGGGRSLLLRKPLGYGELAAALSWVLATARDSDDDMALRPVRPASG